MHIIRFKQEASTAPILPPTTTAYSVLCFALPLASVCLFQNLSLSSSNFTNAHFFFLPTFQLTSDDPFGDPKVIGDPYCTVFVGRLSHSTTEQTLRKVTTHTHMPNSLCLLTLIIMLWLLISGYEQVWSSEELALGQGYW